MNRQLKYLGECGVVVWYVYINVNMSLCIKCLEKEKKRGTLLANSFPKSDLKVYINSLEMCISVCMHFVFLFASLKYTGKKHKLLMQITPTHQLF